jgi:hypothetical protein
VTKAELRSGFQAAAWRGPLDMEAVEASRAGSSGDRPWELDDVIAESSTRA